MSRYAMVIDLSRCNGCNACVVACKVEHNLPPGVLLTAILEKESGQYPDANRIFYPVLCNHCDNPPCVPVCPTRATYRRDDGIVLIDWDRCVGCGACILACPYDQRSYVKDDRTAYPGGSEYRHPALDKAPAGVPVKCDFCYHRVDAGREPACVETCPTGSRIFGTVAGGERPLDALIARNAARRLLPEMGTEPSVYYV